VSASSPDQPAVRITLPAWKPYRLSLTPDGKHLATLDPGDSTNDGTVRGPRLIAWNATTGAQTFKTQLVSLVQSWREARPQRLRWDRSQRRAPGRASRLVGSAAGQGPWGALVGLADFDLLEQLREEAWRARQPAGSPTNPLVERFKPSGLFEQFRVLDSTRQPTVILMQGGQFVDEDPRPLDDPKEEGTDFFFGFNVATAQELRTETVFLPAGPTEAPRDGLFSADGRWEVLIAEGEFRATERDRADWKIRKTSSVIIPGKVRSLACAADGSRLLVLSQDGKLREWDMKKPELRDLQGPKAKLARVLLSGDGRTAGLLESEGGLILWDVPADREKARWKPRDQQVTQVALSADGGRVLLAGDQGPPAVWDPAATPEPRALRDVRSVVALDLSADGKRAAALEAGGGVLVWNLK
jgi:WD40 repeat protein